MLWSLNIESLEQDAGLADLVASHKAAFLTFLLVDLLLLFVDLNAFSRVDDVDNRLGTDALHLLDQLSHMAAVGKWTVDALS